MARVIKDKISYRVLYSRGGRKHSEGFSTKANALKFKKNIEKDIKLSKKKR